MLQKSMEKIPAPLLAANNRSLRESTRRRGWLLSALLCGVTPYWIGGFCVIVTFGYSVFAVQNINGKVLWPTISKLAESDRGWQDLAHIAESPQQLEAVQRISSEWMEKNCDQGANRKDNPSKTEKLLAERLQLRRKGPKTLVVTAGGDWEGDSRSCGCGADMNCQRWVLHASGDRVITLLAYSGFGIVAMKSNSHGYFDVVTGSNTKVGSIELRLWRFDGNVYLPFRCATKTYSPQVISHEDAIEQIDKTGFLSEHSCR